MDTWYIECIGRRTQLGDTEWLLRGSPCPDDFGKESGPVSRKGQSILNLDWLDGHPNRRGGSVKTGTEATIALFSGDIKGLQSKDGILSDRPAVWKYVTVYPLPGSTQTCDLFRGYINGVILWCCIQLAVGPRGDVVRRFLEVGVRI